MTNADITSWADGPLAGLDFESTGKDPESAFIVTACAAMDLPGEEPHVLSWLCNPGVPIPDEAVAVHGITNERVREAGVPEWTVAIELIRTLGSAFGGMPLVIFNAPYDTTLLDRAARRWKLDASPALDRPVIDPLVLDKQLDRYRRGSRKLTDACAHYGITLTDAHDAQADTLAAIALARALAKAYPEIGKMTLTELQEFQVKAKAEQAASLQDYFRRKGSDEVVDPSWPMVPWKEPETVPALRPDIAREQLLRAALRCLSARLAEESSCADADAEYANEMLALAARDLFLATDALPPDGQPVGWAA